MIRASAAPAERSAPTRRGAHRLVVALLLASLVVGLLSGCSSVSETLSGSKGPAVAIRGPNISDQKANTPAAKYADLGLNYMREGQYKTAMEKLRKAIGLDPNLPSAYLYLGQLYARLDEYPDAETYFRKALSLDPNYSRAHNNFGAFLCRRERYAESEAEFLAALDDPFYENAPATLENLGLCTRAAGDIDKARGYFEKALAKDPLRPKSLYELARINYDSGNTAQAKIYLERYRRVAPQSPATLALGIKVEQRLGNDDAEASLRLLLLRAFPRRAEARRLQQGDQAIGTD